MKKILITGGTVFVSRYIAEYYVAKNWDVYVLNRATKEQSKGVKLIQADRHELGEVLRDFHFDVIVDTAYTPYDVETLLDAVGSYNDYILISSSAVYPDDGVQPFDEESPVATNKFWRKYGTDKIQTEAALLKRNPNAYILRPPYIYGPMNNAYREALVFDCALAGRKFYLPKDGEMKLQFFHIQDMCRFIDALLENKPSQHIFNVGNKGTVSIREWVKLCYEASGYQAEFVNVDEEVEQTNYFSFCDYEYYLDVSDQCKLMPETKPMAEGLKESFEWYKDNSEKVNKKPYIDYIDQQLKKEITISKALPEDAEYIIEYLNIVGGETDNLTFGSEGFPVSVEDEKNYLLSLQESTSSVMFVTKRGGEIIGNASFSGMNRERLKHRGEIGISVKKSYWGQGIGSMLLEAIIDFAKNVAHAEIISLEVRSDNARAIRLYEKYGFEKIGCFKGFFKIHGEYVDFDLMNLYLSNEN